MPKERILRCKDYLSELGFHMKEEKRTKCHEWRNILEGEPPEGTEQTLTALVMPEKVQYSYSNEEVFQGTLAGSGVT